MKSVERQDSKGDSEFPVERHMKEKRLNPEKFEEKNIRERLKLQTRKEATKKGPLLAKPSQVSGKRPVGHVQPKIPPGVVPRYQRGKHLSPNNGESAFTRHIVNSNPSSRNTSPNNSRKGKPMSPVNPTRIPQPTVVLPQEKKISGNVRQAPSPSQLDNAVVSLESTKKRVEKVKRARLYLLQQMGPNSFLIGGDSPNHKYRVTIGSQKCGCGKGPDCVHVLFVMLRVFQIKETDPQLWSKTLKNYEVESLFRNYHARRTKKLSGDLCMKPRSGGKSVEQEAENTEVEEEKRGEDKDQSLGSEHSQPKDDEDNCPICLLDMVEGESLVQCVNGCHNRLHHHCIDIWFQNCKRQQETLTCPLCRVQWPSENLLEESTNREDLPAPPNTRVASPVIQHQEPEINQLPHVEPIAEEFMEMATPWIEVFGDNLVGCIFSRHWTDRETSLKHLSRVTQSTLLQAIQDAGNNLDSSSEAVSAAHHMFDCCCAVVAFMCKDPVYRVYVAALKCLRTVLAYTSCSSESDRHRVEEALRPVVESTLVKSAESNNPGLLSISALQELMKGQDGELALGREIDNPGDQGLDGIEYVLSCITHDYDVSEVQWQWLLGRFYILDNLLEEYPREFMVNNDKHVENRDWEVDPPLNYTRVMELIKFCAPVLTFSHSKVERLARRIFYLTARLQIHNHLVLKEIVHLLNDTNTTVRSSMRRRLLKLEEEYHISNEAQNKEGAAGVRTFPTEVYEDFEPIFTTPVVSGNSSPCSLSPVPSDSAVSETGNLARSDPQMELLAPPNSPRKPKERLSKSVNKLREAEANTTHQFEDCCDGLNSLVNTGAFSTPPKASHTHHGLAKSIYHGASGIVTPPPTPMQNTEHSQHPESQDLGIQTTLGSFPVQFTDAPLKSVPKIHVPGISPLIHSVPESVPFMPLVLEKDEPHEFHNLDMYRKYANLDRGDLISFSPEPAYDAEDEDDSTHADSSETSGPYPESYPQAETLLIRNSSTREFTLGSEGFLSHEGVSSTGSASSGKAMSSLDSSRESMGQTVLSLVVGDGEFSEAERELHDDKDEEEEGAVGGTGEMGRIISNDKAVGVGSATSVTREGENVEEEEEEDKEEKQSQTEAVVEMGIKHGHVTLATEECTDLPVLTIDRPTTTHETNSSDDFSELLSPKRDKNKVSFKTEIANSPHHTPQTSPEHNSPDVTEDCHCKEEVEKEEAQALVAAMVQSSGDQSKLPFVPGLSPEEDETLTIHVQQDSVDGPPDPTHSYEESVHWVRGGMLGTGAFSTCYQARDTKTGTLMCVKQISFCRNSQSEQEKVIESVRDEIQMMSKLNHPHIVRILGATQQGCHFFVFVEWMPGGSVAFLLDMYGAFSEHVIVNYIQQILRGLAYLHENHVLHRDLKGANLLIDSTGQRLRMGDFGAAARLASKATGAGEFQGQLLGTIAFMAPEVLQGKNYGRSCDIWSVGCVIIEMFTTKPPWGASAVSNHLALIFKIASTQEAPPIPENMPPGLKDLLLRCLEVNTEERPPAKDLLKHPALTMFKR